MLQREQYTKQKLYEEAFNVSFNWEKFLTPRCYEFHNLTCMETNSPVPLQMGVMLPFVLACLGPTAYRCFLTRPSVLNLFWPNVATSRVGKSETRKRLISEPLEYIFLQPDMQWQTLRFPNLHKLVSFFRNIYAFFILGYSCRKVYIISI